MNESYINSTEGETAIKNLGYLNTYNFSLTAPTTTASAVLPGRPTYIAPMSRMNMTAYSNRGWNLLGIIDTSSTDSGYWGAFYYDSITSHSWTWNDDAKTFTLISSANMGGWQANFLAFY